MKTNNRNTKPQTLRLTPASLEPLRQIREINFRKVRSFSDTSLAAGYETLDLSQMPNGRVKDLLIEFFVAKYDAKRSDRVKTVSLYEAGNTCIVTYYAKHGLGYAWSDDLENEFISWAVRTYNIKPTSKTYKALLCGRCLLSF